MSNRNQSRKKQRKRTFSCAVAWWPSGQQDSMSFVNFGKSIEASRASAKFQQRNLSLSLSRIEYFNQIPVHIITLVESRGRSMAISKAKQRRLYFFVRHRSIDKGNNQFSRLVLHLLPSELKKKHGIGRGEKNRLASRRHARYGAATRMYREREQMRAIRICLTCTRTKTIERTAQRTYLFKDR